MSEGPDTRHPSLDDRFDPAIRIVEYDEAWPRTAGAEMERIAGALGDQLVRIDHVGSTSVPGMPAKPIVDLQASVAEIRPAERYARPLAEHGYLFAPDPESPDFHFFGRPAARPRTFHLHVCAAGSDHELRHLALRDYLRARPEEARRYAEVKRRLVAEHPGDRLAYIDGKADHLAALEERAVMFVEGREMP